MCVVCDGWAVNEQSSAESTHSLLYGVLQIHSGPVTAGVLRGDRARFQLFGDTMNATSRLESTGKAGKIHISSEAAAYIFSAGKHHWLVPREDKVTAKGMNES